LAGQVAVVAGATRGAGRAIAVTLAEAGAFVYGTGRSLGRSAMAGRPELLDDVMPLIAGRGGAGVAVQVDHTQPAQVAALFDRVRAGHGRLDILVDSVWGGDELTRWDTPFWEHSLEDGLAMQARAVGSHLVTAHFAAPLMVAQGRGLIVQMTDGDGFGYRGNLYYDLAKVSVIRLAYGLAQELRPHGVTALALTPGFMRSEAVLDSLGVTEANWRDAIARDPHFAFSETPHFVARAVAALAADPALAGRSGRVFSSWGLAREFGFTDVDGSRPDWGAHWAQAFPGA
jgi:NAD(P)-dependent dehydrogenase (short-subunit alcohol dehydrogenase family)